MNTTDPEGRAGDGRDGRGRLGRWRLVPGGHEADGITADGNSVELSAADARRDQALEELYGAEKKGRGGLEMLRTVQPDAGLVSTLIGLGQVIPGHSRGAARAVIRQVTTELEERLRARTVQAVSGALNRAARTRRPRHGHQPRPGVLPGPDHPSHRDHPGADQRPLRGRDRRGDAAAGRFDSGAGTTMTALPALSDSGHPSFDANHAAALAGIGVPAFACTPDLFPDLMAAAIERRDVGAWAAARDIPTSHET